MIPVNREMCFDIGRNYACNNSSPGNFFSGSIDDVKIWNIALTEAQVKADFHGAGSDCSSADLSCPSSTLICDDSQRKCVPDIAYRSIGTYCVLTDHCDTREGFLKLSCDKDRQTCVAASRGV